MGGHHNREPARRGRAGPVVNRKVVQIRKKGAAFAYAAPLEGSLSSSPSRYFMFTRKVPYHSFGRL